MSTASAVPVVFDRRLLRQRRMRAQKSLTAHDFLMREVAERLLDRLDDIQRRFPLTLEIGARAGLMQRLAGTRGGIERWLPMDLAPSLAGAQGLVADEEWWPIRDGCLDAVLSSMALHSVNDLPGVLAQIRGSLKPDGLLLAALPGGATLHELRTCLMQAELDIAGGAAMRVAPMLDVRQAGALLQRAGFALPVIDSDTITIRYGHPLKLLDDLRAMGESSVLAERPRGLWRRDVLALAMERYQQAHAHGDGKVPATFEIVYLTAWAPAAGQQQPLRPGSAKARLIDALKPPPPPGP